MNTFWLKVVGAVIVVVGIIVLISMFTSNGTQEPEQPKKTFYDQAEEDKQRFLTEPKAVDSGGQDQATENRTVAEHVQPAIEPPKPTRPIQLYFKELGEIDKIEAERLLKVAVPGFSIGRLPMTGYKQLNVDLCRRIIRRWPDSYYAYQAKRMLANLPPRYQTRYKITKEEMDISRFTKPRPGTKPFTIKESR